MPEQFISACISRLKIIGDIAIISHRIVAIQSPQNNRMCFAIILKNLGFIYLNGIRVRADEPWLSSNLLVLFKRSLEEWNCGRVTAKWVYGTHSLGYLVAKWWSLWHSLTWPWPAIVITPACVFRIKSGDYPPFMSLCRSHQGAQNGNTVPN